MDNNIALSDWENLVKKQLKTDDIYGALLKENLEGITVRPYYTDSPKKLKNLPKVEESTQLVSPYYEDSDENTYAFLIRENVEGLQEKSIYVDSKELITHIRTEDENKYFCLADVFGENNRILDELLLKYLNEKNFKRRYCIDISVHQNAGASIIQQLGIALVKCRDLIELLGDDILKTVIFKISIGPNYFFEIAKLRALKILFKQLAAEYNVDEIPYIFAETSLRNKSISDEENNLIRSTFELAAAMIGGADAVFSNDYKILNSNILSSEISFKQQIVLAYESIVNVFEDAANGSFYIDDITMQICEKSWQYFIELENSGGYIENWKSRKIQNDIREHAIREQEWVRDGKIKLIGVNLYPKLDATKTVEELYPEGEFRPVRWAEMYE